MSQSKGANGNFDSSDLPPQITRALHLRATTTTVLNYRHKSNGALEVLIQWTGTSYGRHVEKQLL